jgi:protein involved in polysaccharide export with SLBB domain
LIDKRLCTVLTVFATLTVLVLLSAGSIMCLAQESPAAGGAAGGVSGAAGGLTGTAAVASQAAPGLIPGSLEGTLDADSYVLGAGDRLAIGFWGDVNRVETITVGPDGDLLVAPVGPIAVDGLTLSEVRELIKRKLAPYYKPDILSVSLVGIRSFQVHVVGMVEVPGAVVANGVTRVSQAIALAQGLRQNGSERNIMVKRGGAEIRVDLTRYLRLGDNKANPYLNDGDVVLVPYTSGPVQVSGSVSYPADYEFVEGETAADMIELAGGYRPEAFTDSLTLERFDETDPTVSEEMTLPGDPAFLETFEVKLGDRIFIRAIPDWHTDAQVTVVGEVKYPGVYVIDEGRETLTDLIARAGGLTGKASLAEARLTRGEYRSRPHPIEREVTGMIETDMTEDWKDTDLSKTLSREPKGSVALDYEALLLGDDEAQDILLMDGDILDIPRATNLVRVAGQVNNPGLVEFADGEDHNHYIDEAGGYGSKADKRGTVLIRSAGGTRLKAGGRTVKAGDIIWVPKRPDYSWWGITKEVLTVAAQIATVWLVVDSITDN